MCFRCGSEDYFIANFPKTDILDKKVYWNTRNPKTRVYIFTKIDKTLENSTDESRSQKIYTSMARMFTNTEIPRIDYVYISQLTYWILDSGVTCHMTPEI